MHDVNIVDERRYRSSLYSNASGHGFKWLVVRGDKRVTCLTVGVVRDTIGLSLGDDDAVVVFEDSTAGLEAANNLRDQMNAALGA